MNPLQNFLKNYGVGSKFTGLDSYMKKTPSASNPVVTSAPAAVYPQPKPITPPVTPPQNSGSTARDQFTQDQLAQYNKTTAMFATPSNTTTPPVNNVTTPVTTPTPTPTPKKNPFQDYLDSFNAKDVISDNQKAQQRLADIQSRNELQAVSAREQYEKTLDKSGGLKSGAEQAASIGARRNSASAAYGAVEESAAARSALVAQNTYQAYIDAGKSVEEANAAAKKAETDATQQAFENDLATKKSTTEGQFNLAPGETRYDAQGNVIASGGPKPLSQAQEAAQIAATEKEQAAQQSASQSVGIINNLLTGDRYKAISGLVQTGSIPFLGDRAAAKEYGTLQGLLKLGIRSLIKGQGAVSDYEGKILGDASSSLSRGTSQGQMEKALRNVRGVLKTNQGLETEVIVRDSSGQIIGTGLLNGTDIYDAVVRDGNTVEYL
jgi:hypothetical protein